MIASDSVGCAWRGAGDLGGGRLERHRERDLGDQLGRAVADDVRADDLAEARLGDQLGEARGVRRRDRLARRREREACRRAPRRTCALRLGLGAARSRRPAAGSRCRPGSSGGRAAGARARPSTRPPRRPLRSPCARGAAHPRGRRSRARSATLRREARVDRARSPSRRSRRRRPRARGRPRAARRPIASSTWSASSASLASPLRTATRTPDGSTFSSSKRVPVRISIFLRRNSRSTTCATSGSAPGSICSAISITVTLAPYIA